MKSFFPLIAFFSFKTLIAIATLIIIVIIVLALIPLYIKSSSSPEMFLNNSTILNSIPQTSPTKTTTENTPTFAKGNLLKH